MSFDTVITAIEAIKAGKMVLMVDDEDRENEGDLVYAATFSTPDKVNFMTTHARGLICVALNSNVAKRLKLNPMVIENDSCHETAFTVSVDARLAKTGISTYERDMTIKILADHASIPKDLVRPGHIFPLIAKDGGVLERTGHTEGSVDLCKLAGVNDVAVICEVLKENGEMARRGDLDDFCMAHDIPIVSISDIVKYRMKHESLITEISCEDCLFLEHQTKKRLFKDHQNNTHIVYTFGSINEQTAVKFHKISTDHELLSNQKAFFGLIDSVKYLAKNNGVLIFLDVNHTETNEQEMKTYGIGAQILNYLGVSKIELLYTFTIKEFIGIDGFGLEVVKKINIQNKFLKENS